MTLEQMLDDLPRSCNVGSKKNSKGYQETWAGYKLHLDVADGQIPISCILTSASLHDSQAAIPLARLTAQRVTHLYDLMDSAYDARLIHEHPPRRTAWGTSRSSMPIRAAIRRRRRSYKRKRNGAGC
jgi:hypothetical protein